MESVGVSVKRRLPWVILGLVVYLVIVPFVFRSSGYWLTTFINASILGFISLGVWLTFSIGRINICQGAFALIGGYTLAILSTRYAVPFWLAVPASGVVAALLGFIIGWPILRLRGVYFAMLTLSLTEATRLAMLNFKGLTEGASGILNIPTPFTTGNTYLAWYFFTAILVVLGIFVIYRITTCRLGWVFRALQQDEALAASIGINVAWYRVIAFAICCAFGGIGGAVFTAYVQSIYPTSFTVTDSTNFMLYCFLGGLQYVIGPVVGAFVLFLGFQFLSVFNSYQTLIYALLLIASMLLLPNGLLSLRLPGFGPRKTDAAPKPEIDKVI